MDVKRSCSNCLKGMNISVNNDILCRDKGVVSAKYVCRKHRFAPQSRSEEVAVFNKCADCEHFIMDANTSGDVTMGLCRLFSVRKYNGRDRKACSKFSRYNKLEVS